MTPLAISDGGVSGGGRLGGLSRIVTFALVSGIPRNPFGFQRLVMIILLCLITLISHLENSVRRFVSHNWPVDTCEQAFSSLKM